MSDLLRKSVMFLSLLAVALFSVTQAQARHAVHAAHIMVICTGDGFARITLDADGNPVEPILHCPDCVLGVAAHLAGGGAMSPAPLSASILRLAARRDLVVGSCAGVWHDSRAPPALV